MGDFFPSATSFLELFLGFSLTAGGGFLEVAVSALSITSQSANEPATAPELCDRIFTEILA